MKKDIKKSLDEKMTVELPEELSKDNIMKKLGEPHIVEAETKKAKRFNAKRLIPVAASLMLVAGLLGVYFSAPFANDAPLANKTPPAVSSGEVVKYESYDNIYAKFNELKKTYDEKNEHYYGEIWLEDAEATINGSDGASPSAPEAGDDMDESVVYDKHYGETNRQEKGVDEGDIIKTDGRYIYALNTYGSRFTVADCADGKMTAVAQIQLEKGLELREMYISGNYALFIGYRFDTETSDGVCDPGYDGVSKEYAARDCIYGYNSGETVVLVYDITDKTTPKKVTEYTQQGSFNFSRMIGTKLYCVSSYYVSLDGEDLKDNCIPEVAVNGSSKKLLPGEISVITDTKCPSYAVVTTFEAGKDAEPAAEAVLGSCDNLYATTGNLFLAENAYENGDQTKIYKFSYTDDGVEYNCMGKVGGFLNNQFSLSSQGDYLRVATTETVTELLEETTSAQSSADTAVSSFGATTNTLYILDKDMKEAGKLENLANGERIKSARFVGNTAYIVTFRQTDPLFVIDTADPCNPKLLGELKITGFSQYLHPMADGVLIGIGRDGTADGENGDGKVSLFDVKDPANPTEASKCTVLNGAGYVHSDIFANHKLFVQLSENEFAVPFILHRYAGSNTLDEVVYIRYRVNGTTLEEVARYNLGSTDTAVGGTFIEDNFYAVVNNYSGKCELASFNLQTNEETGRIEL